MGIFAHPVLYYQSITHLDVFEGSSVHTREDNCHEGENECEGFHHLCEELLLELVNNLNQMTEWIGF